MLFLDTSALVKRYVQEEGTRLVEETMAADPEWVASALARAEAEVTLCRRGLDDAAMRRTREALGDDWGRFHVVPLDAECLERAMHLGCAHQLRTLDAIHLAAAHRLLSRPVRFLSFDRRQAGVAAALGLDVVPIADPQTNSDEARPARSPK